MLLRFITGSIIGMITAVIGGVLVVVLLLGAGTLALAATGGPEKCTPGGGTMNIDRIYAASFRDKWDAFEDTLDGGAASSVQFNESEISSRAQEYLDEEGVDIDDAQVCIHDGSGEGTGTFKFLGLSIKAKVTGNLDLSGDKPKADIDDIEVGNVPGFMTARRRAVREQRRRQRARGHRAGPPVHADADRRDAQIDGQP